MDDIVLKRLQSLELEMAKVLLSICERHNLKIWADGGTLLGAVRHGGFIPWDDDIDFVMFRDDYEKLKEIAKKEALPEPYYFEDAFFSFRFNYGGTTMFVPNAKLPDGKGSGNGGSVWIDINCLDKLPEIDADFQNQWKKFRRYDRKTNNKIRMCFASAKGIKGKCWHLLCSFCNVEKREKKVDRFCKQFQGVDCDILSKLPLYMRIEKFSDVTKLPLYNKDWYDDTVILPFNGLNMPCPVNYDLALRTMYGNNYMTPLKVASLHGEVIINLDRPYQEVVNELLHEIPWWKRFFYKH